MSVSAEFNESYYLSNNADVVVAISQGFFTSALQHFTLFGGKELRAPNSTFDASYYAINNPDVLNAVSAGGFNNVFEHFQQFGETENRAPTEAFASFDAAAYLAANSDVQDAVTAGSFKSALDHFIAFGQNEGRSGGVTVGTTVNGTSFTLTNSVDNPTLSANNDAVSGVFGSTTAANNTYASGDVLSGGAGTDVLTLQSTGAQASGAVTVGGFETINVTATLNSNLDGLLFSDDPAINFLQTVNGQTVQMTNANIGSTYGLAGQGDLTVGYVNVTGSSDTAKLSLSGAGTVTNNNVALNVSTTNAIEAVEIATTGTNFAALTAGTGAGSITITGSGTNDLTITSSKSTTVIDAASATGDNTIRMGTALSLGDSFTGGSGSDKLIVDLASAVQYLPTASSIETMEVDFSAAATLNLNSATGVTTFTLTDQAAAVVLSNVEAAMSTVNLGKGTAVSGTNNITIGYKSGSATDQTVTYGATAAATNPAIDTGDLTITGNTGALTILSGGDAANLLDAVAVNSASAVTIKGDAQALTTTTVSATGAASFTVDASLKNTTVGNVTLDETATAVNVTGAAGNVTTGTVGIAGATGDLDVDVNIESTGTKTTQMGVITVAGVATKAATADIVATNNSTGAMIIGGVTMDGSEDDNIVNLNLAANSGDLTITTVDLISRVGAEDTKATIIGSAASGKTLTITNLTATITTGTEQIDTITLSGAGTISIGAGTSSLAQDANTVVDATATTGNMTIDLESSAGNMTIALGDAGTGNTNTVVAGAGADAVTGGSGVDNISGFAGTDTISAGGGADIIDGGAGADIISLTETTAAVDTVSFTIHGALASTANADNITDFRSGSDKLSFDAAVIAGGGAIAATSGTAATSGAVTAGALIDDRITVISNGGVAAKNGGAQTIASYTDLTDVAAYLSEAYSTTANNDAGIFVINNNSGTAYIYIFDEQSNTGAGLDIQAADLGLLGIVTEVTGGAIVAGDIA